MAIRNPNLDEEIIGYDKIQTDEINAQIITSGSNPNGSWTKFPDGTMICRRSSTINFDPSPAYSISLNYPSTFVGLPSVSIGFSETGWLPWITTFASTFVSSGTNHWQITIRERNNETNTVHLLAIGRWK